MDVNKAIKERRSIRKFSGKFSFDDLAKIIDVSRYAPMAGNIFSVRLIVISNSETKTQIAKICAEQLFIQDATYLVVVCTDSELTQQMYGDFASAYIKQQAGASIQNMLLQAEELRVASCWIGAFDENALKTLLKIPDSIDVEAVLAFGKSETEKKSKDNKGNPKVGWQVPRKMDLNSITSFEVYGRWHRWKGYTGLRKVETEPGQEAREGWEEK